MKFGLILRSTGPGATPEAIEAGAETAEKLGWVRVWTTDHVLAPSSVSEYNRVYEAIETLAWVGARHEKIGLGTSVIVVPQRNGVLLAKELATLDALSGGRLVAGVGVGWNETEFVNLGVADRFTKRGAYLDETIRLWRHLWSGTSQPFFGAFHSFIDFAFEPLPAQGDRLPIVIGGRSDAALRRAGALGDGYQATATGPEEMARRAQIIREAAEAAGRPMPRLSARVRVAVEAPKTGYAMTGNLSRMFEDIKAFEAAGVEELDVQFEASEPESIRSTIENFDRQVVKGLV
jgi:probable F420-dependent oxidoreductase